MNNKIALQLYTLRNFLKTEADIETTLERVAKIGYRFVELAGLGPIEPAKLRALLDKNKLTCVSMHIGAPDLEKDIEAVFAKMKILGTTAAAIGALPNDFRNKAGYESYAPKLEAWAQTFKKNGFRLGYHNHKFEFEKCAGFTTTAFAYLFKNAPSLYSELDVFWAQYGGSDPAAIIRSLKGQLQEVHFKDFTIRNDQVIMAEVGEGNLNWPSIVAACKEVGATTWIVEQDTCETDPFECVATSFKNISRWVN